MDLVSFDHCQEVRCCVHGSWWGSTCILQLHTPPTLSSACLASLTSFCLCRPSSCNCRWRSSARC
jgi:hypothetical protein